MRLHTAGIAILLAVVANADARTLDFRATLSGTAAPTNTGSKAKGTARIHVDTGTQRISVELSVNGITIDGLWDQLVAAPIGPIHFHQYPSRDHSGGDVALVQSRASFDHFVKALQTGTVVLNIHTDQFHDGEISGTVQ